MNPEHYVDIIVQCLNLPDGNIAVSCFDSKIHIRSQCLVSEVETLTEHSKIVECLLSLPENRMASGSWDKLIIIWDICTFKPIIKLDCPCYVMALVYLPNGHMASGDFSGNIFIWDVATYKKIGELKAGDKSVTSFAVLHNGNLASASKDGKIYLWDIDNMTLIGTLVAHSRHIVTCLAVLYNGYLASGSYDKTIIIWNTDEKTQVTTLFGHTDPISSLIVLPDRSLASGSFDNSVILWDVENCMDFKRRILFRWSVSSMSILPSGMLLVGTRGGGVSFCDEKMPRMIPFYPYQIMFDEQLKKLFPPDTTEIDMSYYKIPDWTMKRILALCPKLVHPMNIKNKNAFFS